jgi:hypothetical protein
LEAKVSESMLERLARAICCARGEGWGGWMSPQQKARAIGIAREVMRELEVPTEGMLAAANNSLVANGSPMSKGAHEVWLAMVKAAEAGK